MPGAGKRYTEVKYFKGAEQCIVVIFSILTVMVSLKSFSSYTLYMCAVAGQLCVSKAVKYQYGISHVRYVALN